ncbi:MAG: Crp/Fnr family transcriptional regulator [Actinobacteria bacterium]|nr:Crp/Fnr family transcriptional regulator [Actinomycetota bacterium]
MGSGTEGGERDGMHRLEWRSLLPHLRPSGQQAMATHVAWIARDFGRRDLSPLSDEDVEALGRVLEPMRVEAGRKVLSPGEPSDAAYIVERGEVELYLRRGRRRTLVGIQRAGGVFGDVPLLCEVPFPYSAVARTDSVLLKLPRDRLTDVLTRHPAIALRWLSSVVKRLEHANRRIVGLTVGDLRARTLALLADEIMEGVRPAGALRLTQAELAALLGASRQSVNRVLGGLAREGLIRQLYGEIEVVEGERVLELAGGQAFVRRVC